MYPLPLPYKQRAMSTTLTTTTINPHIPQRLFQLKQTEDREAVYPPPLSHSRVIGINATGSRGESQLRYVFLCCPTIIPCRQRQPPTTTINPNVPLSDMSNPSREKKIPIERGMFRFSLTSREPCFVWMTDDTAVSKLLPRSSCRAATLASYSTGVQVILASALYCLSHPYQLLRRSSRPSCPCPSDS